MHESDITVIPQEQCRYWFENTDLNSLKFLGLFIAAKINGRCLHHEHGYFFKKYSILNIFQLSWLWFMFSIPNKQNPLEKATQTVEDPQTKALQIQ